MDVRRATVRGLAILACALGATSAGPAAANAGATTTGPTAAPAGATPRPGAPAGAGATATATAATAVVTLVPHGRATTIPPSFLGVSVEDWGLPLFEQHPRLFARTLALIHPQGPMTLRVGGDSADRSSWLGSPPQPYALTRAWLSDLGATVRRLGLRVLLDLNLRVHSPAMASRFAAAVLRALPAGSLAGLEIGNEPDLYGGGYGAAKYARDFGIYLRALGPIGRGRVVIGPELATPTATWLSTLLAANRVGALSAHRYPLVACLDPSKPRYPTVPRLLGEFATAGMARTVSAGIRLAHRRGIPFYLTEINSVTCGGLAGVSDTFATALWAPDALFEYIRAGADAVNVHVRARAINAAFALSDHGLRARPLLYGLILFARTLGPRARLIPVKTAARDLHLKAWAVMVQGGRLHLLLLNKGPRTAHLRIALPAIGVATVQLLRAPALDATSGLTLAGQRLSADGGWIGVLHQRTLDPGPSGYTLALAGFSAALVSVPLAASDLAEEVGV